MRATRNKNLLEFFKEIDKKRNRLRWEAYFDMVGRRSEEVTENLETKKKSELRCEINFRKINHYKCHVFYRTSEHNYRKKVEIFLNASTLMSI